MPASTTTPVQILVDLLHEAVALDDDLIETDEISRQRPGALALVSRCNVLLGLLARDAQRSSAGSLGRTATTRALMCKAAIRLAMLENEPGAVARWIALACNQATDLLAQIAAASPSHPEQIALNDVAQCLAVALLAADTADRVRLRELLRRCLDAVNANSAVLNAENELGVDALNDAVVFAALAQQARLPSDRSACLDKAVSSGRIASDHFGRINNLEFWSRAEHTLRELADRRGSSASARPEAAAATNAGAVGVSVEAPAVVPHFCSACGAGVQPGWKFCKACGAPLRPRDSTTPGGSH